LFSRGILVNREMFVYKRDVCLTRCLFNRVYYTGFFEPVLLHSPDFSVSLVVLTQSYRRLKGPGFNSSKSRKFLFFAEWLDDLILNLLTVSL
jgi:hypothetical protein